MARIQVNPPKLFQKLTLFLQPSTRNGKKIRPRRSARFGLPQTLRGNFSRQQSSRRHLLPWIYLALILAGVLAVWGLSFFWSLSAQLWDLLGNEERATFVLELVKIGVSLLFTVALILGGLAIFWNIKLTQERLMTERFSEAVKLLGTDRLEIRLGGIYALERLARESPENHWLIMEVLTAFVQQSSLLTLAKGQRKISGDFQAALTVVGRRAYAHDPEEQFLNLSNARLEGADLQHVYLAGADLKSVHLTAADLQGANLEGADLRGAHLERADLRLTCLRDARLDGANLEGALLKETNLERANLEEADLNNAHLEGANLRGANLTGANLKTAMLQEAYLEEADLRGQILEGTQLTGAYLAGAHLEAANLSHAYLEKADLRGAYLDLSFFRECPPKRGNV